jgi:ligand-binding sensor domain-containing protein/signal transduction histidine kinase
MAVQQDGSGYIWIATSSGLQRYDGHRFLTIRHEAGNPTSIPDGAIYNIAFDWKNRLWLLLGGTRIGWLDTRDLTFHEVPVKYPREILNKSGAGIYLDRDGKLMLAAVGNAVFTYNEENREFAEKHNRFTLPKGWKPIHIWQDIKRNYWIGCDSGLVKYSTHAGQMSYRGHNAEKDRIIETLGNAQTVVFTYTDRSGRFWMTSWPNSGMKIWSLDTLTGYKKEWQNILGRSINNKYYELRAISELSDSSIMFSGHNLFARMKKDGSDLQVVANNLPGEYSIRYDGVNQLFQDGENNVWISTNKGLFRFNPFAQLFRAVQNRRPSRDSVFEPDVTGIMQTSDGKILVSTWGSGMFSYDSTFKPIESKVVQQGLNEREGMTWCMVQLSNGNILRGNQEGTLFAYDASTGKTRKIKDSIFESSTIRQVVDDGKGYLWFGTQRGFVVKWNPATESGSVLHRLQSTVNRLYRDSSGMIWVCTTTSGLLRLDPSSGKIIAHYKMEGMPGTVLRGINATDIIQYNDSIFVIAANGLNLLNIRTGKFRYFSAENGLETNDITNLVKDKDGYIWMSTGIGIVSFHPVKSKLSLYNSADGVHTNAFHVGSSRQLSDGRIAFGTAHDILLFNPYSVTISEYVPPRVFISEMSLMSNPLKLDSVMKLKRVELQHDETSMVIDLSTLTYQNEYPIYYMMEGLDKAWVKAGNQSQAIYNYLPPGDYTFKTGCNNPDGSIGQITRLNITVKAPFWNTRWFYSLIGLAIAAGLFWLDRQRQQRMRSEHQMRTAIAGNLHEDVNTTLQDISMLSEIAGMKAHTQPEKSKEYIYEIQRKSRNMVIAMNDVLWSIDPVNDNMPRTVERIHEVAQAMRSRYDVEVEVDADETIHRLNLSMKIRLEFIIIYKLAILALVEELRAPKTRVNLYYLKGKLYLFIQASGVELERSNGSTFKYLAEMKTRANSIHATLNILSGKSGTEIKLGVRV